MLTVVILPPLGGSPLAHGLPPVSSVASPNFGGFGRCAPPYADHPRAGFLLCKSYRQCCLTIRHATNPPNVSKKDSKLARTGNTGSDRKLIICNHLASSMLCDYRFVISPPMRTQLKRRARRRRRSHRTNLFSA